MRCSSCQFESPASMRFCVQCGAALPQRCPSCGSEVAATFRFCGLCGASLPAPPAAETARATSPPSAATAVSPRVASYTPKHLADKVLKARSAIEGERRQVSVLFADIAGFTSIAEGRDPEEV